MSKIYKIAIPANSVLKQLRYTDYTDALATTIERTDIDVDDFVNCFFTVSPPFVATLMKIRDFIVRFFGLKTGKYERAKQVKFEAGKEIGLFKMFEKHKNEAIIGADDKHLNFRVSLYVLPGVTTTEIIISTVVHFNNKWGKAYMKIISPFHKIVVKSIIKKIKKNLLLTKK